MRLKSIEQKTYKTLRINLGRVPHPNNKNFRKEKQTAGKKRGKKKMGRDYQSNTT